MGVNDWVQIAIAVGTICAVLISVATVRHTNRKETVQDQEKRIRELARAEDETLKDRLHDHSIRLTQSDGRDERMETILKELSVNYHTLADTLTQMQVKVDFYWEQVAMNAAKQLHQPDPRRAHIDSLLESFMEGTLSNSERLELKKILIQMRNWEPGKTLDFPVHAGEPTAAAILLGTMDLVDPKRMAASGHSMHRDHTYYGEDTNA